MQSEPVNSKLNSRLTRAALFAPAIVIGMLPTTGLGLWLALPLILNHALYMIAAAGLLNLPRGESLKLALGMRVVPVVVVLALLVLPGVLMVGVPLAMVIDGARGFFTAIAAISILAYVGLTLPFWLTYPLAATWRQALRHYSGLLSPAQRAATVASDFTLASASRMLLALPVLLGFWALCGLLWWLLDGTLYPARRFQVTVVYAFIAAPAIHVALAAYARYLFADAERPAPEPELEPLPREAPRALYGPSTAGTGQALIEAVRAQQITGVERLIELGADVDAAVPHADRGETSALLEACRLGHPVTVEMLLNANADPGRKVGGESPLHAAASAGNTAVVEQLIRAGARPEVADADGETPLHRAAGANHAGAIQALGEGRAGLETADRRHLTPLGLACQQGSWDAAVALLQLGADLHTDAGHLPLSEAAGRKGDDIRGVELLLSRGADPGRRGRLKRTPLMAAALADNGKIADILLRAGADIDARDRFGISALMEAARAGANSVLEEALFWEPDTAFRDKSGRTALHVAAASRKADARTVALLMQMGADPTARSTDGSTPRRLAEKLDREEIVKALQAPRTPPPAPREPRPASIKTETAPLPAAPPAPEQKKQAPLSSEPPKVQRTLVRDTATRLAEAARADDLATCAQIIDEYGRLPSATLWVAFLEAARADARLVPTVLLAEGLDANHREEGDAPLLTLISRMTPPPLATLRALVERGAALEPPGEDEPAPLLLWLQATPSSLTDTGEPDDEGQRALTALIEAAGRAGADPDVRDADGRLALSWALERHSAPVIEALLKAGADPNKADKGGETPLMATCRSDRADAANLVRLLARYGGDPHLKGASDTSAFRLAMQSGDQTLLTFLMTGSGSGADEAGALIAAAQDGNAQRVSQLLDGGLDIDATDTVGRSALWHAAKSGHYRLVETLVRRGASVDRADHHSVTPLGAAVSAGHADLARLLQLAGADVSRPQAQGRTPLIVAAADWDAAMTAQLLALGAQADERDRGDSTALMAAAQAAQSKPATAEADATLRVLIEAGADVNAVNDDNQSALMLLAGIRSRAAHEDRQAGAADFVRLLMGAGADVRARDVSGWTALHAAAGLGAQEIVRALVQGGADPHARDINGNAPADIALERGHLSVAADLEAEDQARNAS